MMDFEILKIGIDIDDTINASIMSDIGRGDSGIAYLLSNEDVLKITTNAQEGKVADYFWNNPNPHVVEYKLVWKEGDLYYIVMVEPLLQG